MAKLGSLPWICVCGDEVEIPLSAREGVGTHDVTGRKVINITAQTVAVTNHIVSCEEFAEALSDGYEQFELLKEGLDLEDDDEEIDLSANSGNADPAVGPTTFDGGQQNEVEQKLWGDGIETDGPTPGYGHAPAEPEYDQGGDLESGSVTVPNESGKAEPVLTEEQAKALASDDDTSSGS